MSGCQHQFHSIVCDCPETQKQIARDGRARAITDAVDVDAKYRTFVALRDELVEANVCLYCGTQSTRRCHCENDE